MTLHNQSFFVKMSAFLTMIMFIGGLINGIFSLLTFQSIELRRVGCGMYLLSSSITSLLTITMLTVKFWFVVLTQINIPRNLSILRSGCVSVEPLLKVFVSVDTWLNACVAIERAVTVRKGINFNEKKSKCIARWIIIILPIFVMVTIIHEPIHRHLLLYTTEKYKSKQDENSTNELTEYDIQNNESDYETENHILCVVHYSRSVQDYNTAILFFHLIAPFIANLFSALYIIFGTARQRSITRTKQSYKEHVLEQLSKHKQLVISPIVLLILSLPRLIFSLISGCVEASKYPWLYLCGYFISFTPSILIFVVFVLPSQVYMKTFKESLRSWRQLTH